MSNSFNISVKPEIAAVKTVVDANSVILVDVHDTDLPAVVAEIDDNETKIDGIVTVTDAIKLKSDLLPTNIRGKLYLVRPTTTGDTFVDAVSVSGHGKLIAVAISGSAAGTNVELKITLDGTALPEITHTGDTTHQHIIPIPDIAGVSNALFPLPAPAGETRLFDLEFNATLLVQFRLPSGGGTAYCKVIYTLDTL